MNPIVMRVVAVVLWVFLSLGRTARADEALPPALDGVGIEDQQGAKVPLDAALRDQDGKAVRLGDYVAGKPAILVLAYYECPMLCSLVINGVRQGMSELAWTAGQQYRTVVVSFDPRDTPELAGEKRKNYVRAYGRNVDDRGWDFLVGDEGEVRRIADAVGFHYRWDESSKQYAHAAGAFVLTPDGRVSRTLYGITFPARDLRLALIEASAGKLGAAWERVQLFCYHYDPTARTYVVSPTRVMQLGGVATMAVLGGMLFGLWSTDVTRRRLRKARGDARPVVPHQDCP